VEDFINPFEEPTYKLILIEGQPGEPGKFTHILKNTTYDQCRQIAEKINKEIKKHPLFIEVDIRKITTNEEGATKTTKSTLWIKPEDVRKLVIECDETVEDDRRNWGKLNPFSGEFPFDEHSPGLQ